MKPVVLLSLVSLAVFAPTAAAQVEETGSGEAIEHVKNIAYPNLNAEDEVNAGTDIEFADIQVPVTTSTKKGGKKRAPTTQARTFAFAGSYGDGLQIVDITDPATRSSSRPGTAASPRATCRSSSARTSAGAGSSTYTHDDGYDFHLESQCAEDLAMGIDGRVAAVDPDGSSGPESFYGAGTYIADVTDPYNPKTVSFVPVSRRARTTRRCTRRGSTSTTPTPT